MSFNTENFWKNFIESFCKSLKFLAEKFFPHWIHLTIFFLKKLFLKIFFSKEFEKCFKNNIIRDFNLNLKCWDLTTKSFSFVLNFIDFLLKNNIFKVLETLILDPKNEAQVGIFSLNSNTTRSEHGALMEFYKWSRDDKI